MTVLMVPPPSDCMARLKPLLYPPAMVLQRRSGFIEPCQPSKVVRPPSGPLWVHEIKHDGYRLMVRRDGSRAPQLMESLSCL